MICVASIRLLCDGDIQNFDNGVFPFFLENTIPASPQKLSRKQILLGKFTHLFKGGIISRQKLLIFLLLTRQIGNTENFIKPVTRNVHVFIIIFFVFF